MRSRSEKRFLDKKKTLRKKRLLKDKGFPISDEENRETYWYLNNCSFSDSFRKTNNKGKKRRIPGNYAPSYNPSRRDKRLRDSAEDQEN